MSWEQAQARAEEQGPSVFVKLADDGDKVIGKFGEEVFVRETVWDNGEYRPATPKDKNPTKRFVLNLYVPDEGQHKVFEANQPTFKAMLAVKAKYGLDKWYFEITRNGKKGATKTTYSILPEREIPEADRAKIAAAPLQDLKRANDAGDGSTDLNSHDKAAEKPAAAAGAAPPPASTPVAPAAADPIVAEKDPELAKKILARVKAQPAACAAAFVAKFTAIKLIKASQLPEVEAFLKPYESPAEAADPLGL